MQLQKLLTDLRNLLHHSKHARAKSQTRKVSCSGTDVASSTDNSPTHQQHQQHQQQHPVQVIAVAPAPKDDQSEQSPIDICAMDADLVRQDDEAIGVTVASAPAHVVHTGSNFHVEWEGEAANALTIKGKTYYAVQFHFHAPSEHTLCGKHEAMELHLVHKADDGSLAVVALFFREGKENAFLTQFWSELPGLHHGQGLRWAISKKARHHHDTTVHLRKQVNPASLHLLEGQFYRYRGSLTTPPYTEGVEWIVVQDVAEASARQIARYRHTIPRENAREVQPRNHRLVTLRRPCACAV